MARGNGLATGSLTNLDTNESLFFQFQPEAIEESIDVEWGLELPISGSHEVGHYSGTRSERIPIRLFYTVIPGLGGFAGTKFTAGGSAAVEQARAPLVPAGGGRNTITPNGPRPPQQRLDVVERFLKALCYGAPVKLSGRDDAAWTALSIPPPRVLFSWPSILQLEGYIDRLKIRYERFDGEDLSPLSLVADLDFREAPIRRITAEDVRRNGSFRVSRHRALPERITPQTQEVTITQRFPSAGFGRFSTGAP